MSEDFQRYAVYWAPERGSALAAFGAAWLGWDAEAGVAAPRLPILDLPAPVEILTATPRRYGFHATLKPPFRLADGAKRAALEAALEALAASAAPIEAPPLEMSADLGFPALRPAAPCAALDALAARCVVELDQFRAPPPPDELARRRAAGLTGDQERNLLRWGYPYVLDAFRFHLTLANALPQGDADALLRALSPHLEGVLGAPLHIGELCLFGDPGGARPFRLLRRLKLGD